MPIAGDLVVEHRADDLERVAPDVLGIMLDPAGARIMLRELARLDRQRRAGAVEADRAGGGGALIDRDDVAHGVRSEIGGEPGGVRRHRRGGPPWFAARGCPRRSAPIRERRNDRPAPPSAAPPKSSPAGGAGPAGGQHRAFRPRRPAAEQRARRSIASSASARAVVILPPNTESSGGPSSSSSST